jgi:hypothetical protein
MLTVQGVYEKGRVQIKEAVSGIERCDVFVTFLPVANGKKLNNSTALDRLCGMFKNTSLLSSDDFSKNKEYEKKLEEEKFKHG